MSSKLRDIAGCEVIRKPYESFLGEREKYKLKIDIEHSDGSPRLYKGVLKFKVTKFYTDCHPSYQQTLLALEEALMGLNLFHQYADELIKLHKRGG